MKRLMGVLTGILILVGCCTALSAAPANAQPVATQPVVASVLPSAVLGPEGGGNGLASALNEKYLPLNRWANATGQFHTRLGANIWDNPFEKLQTWTQSTVTSIGTFEWKLAASFADGAIRFTAFDSLGTAMDKAFASVGNAVLGRGSAGVNIVAIIIIFSIIATVYRSMRTGMQTGAWKKLIGALAVVAALALMTTGAMRSTGGGTDGGTYVPGKFSPGWFATQLNSAVTTLTNAPAEALAGTTLVTGADTTRYVSCADYVNALNARSKELDPKTATPKTEKPNLGKNQNAVPTILSAMWVNTGLSAWSTTQFSDATPDGGNDGTPYYQYVYCHLLDASNGVTPGVQRGIFTLAAPRANPDDGSVAFKADNNIMVDENMVAWASCRLKKNTTGRDVGSWDIARPFNNLTDKKITQQDCVSWWTDPEFDMTNSNFEFADSEAILNSTKSQSQDSARTYLMTLQGYYASSGAMSAFAYLLSGLGVLISFGALSAVILLGKIAQVFMMFALVFVLLSSMWTSKSDGNKVIRYAKTCLGVAVFVSCGALLMAMMTLLATLLNGLVTDVFGTGTMSMMWTGVAPLMSMGLIAAGAKQMGMPNPFKLGSALAFGAMAGGVGGVVASKVSGMGDMAKAMATGKARNTADRALGGGGSHGPARSGGGGTGVAPSQVSKGAGAAARRGSYASSLIEMGGITGQTVRDATGTATAMSSADKVELQKKQLQTQKEIQTRAHEVRKEQRQVHRAAKVQHRREHNDALIAAHGPKGGKDEHGNRIRLAPENHRQRAAALAKGKAAEKLNALRHEPIKSMKAIGKTAGAVGLVGATFATGGLAAPVAAGVMAVRAKRSGQIREARRKVSDGWAKSKREATLLATNEHYEKAKAKAADSYTQQLGDEKIAALQSEIDAENKARHANAGLPPTEVYETQMVNGRSVPILSGERVAQVATTGADRTMTKEERKQAYASVENDAAVKAEKDVLPHYLRGRT